MKQNNNTKELYMIQINDHLITKPKRTINPPLKMNSKKVFKFSGEGLVTKMLLRPKCTAAATDNPRAADLPRPRPAVTESIPLPLFSVITSIIFRRALACVVMSCFLMVIQRKYEVNKTKIKD